MGMTQPSLHRSEQQVSDERVLAEVGQAMLAVEAAAERVAKAADVLSGDPAADSDMVAAVRQAASDLKAMHRRMHQRAYLPASQRTLFDT
jgi:predicted flap endonuclease-1-like 5' DNA nuclease